MAELTTSAGLPQPEIEDAGGCVTVRFRPAHYVSPQRLERDLTERQQAVLALLDQAGRGLALREIVPLLKLQATRRQVQKDLGRLRALALVVSTGHGLGARWKRV